MSVIQNQSYQTNGEDCYQYSVYTDVFMQSILHMVVAAAFFIIVIIIDGTFLAHRMLIMSHL